MVKIMLVHFLGFYLSLFEIFNSVRKKCTAGSVNIVTYIYEVV